MIFNFNDELQTIKTLLIHGNSILENVAASEAARLGKTEHIDEGFVEEVLTAPDGSHALEQLICRSVVNELNSLCEFVLQNAWINLSGNQLELQKGGLIYTAKRGDIERSLRESSFLGDKATKVEDWPHWEEVLKIKELSEGFKHRVSCKTLI